MSANSQIIKLWNEKNGNSTIVLNPKKRINDICHIKNSGFIFVSTMDPHVDCWYLPLLGPAPAWSCILNRNKTKKFNNLFKFSKMENNFSKKFKKDSCLNELAKYI